MKALVLHEYMHLEICDVPCPEPTENEVLVAVKACGICGSDVHGMDGSTGRRIPPIIMGHEASGVIVKRGTKVNRWKEGDRVTFDSTVYCGKCLFCRRGKVNLCDSRQVFGVSCQEYKREGAFAEFVAVPEHILFPLPDEVSFEEAAMIEPLSVALHAVLRSEVHLDDNALVVGTGMIGLLIVQLLKTVGVRKIICADIDPGRLLLASDFGADLCLDPQQASFSGAIFQETEGVGVDCAFEVVGNEKSFSSAIRSVRKGGNIVLVGNLAPQVSLPLQHAVTRELSLLGSCASSGEYPRCLDLLAQKVVDLRPLISAVAPLEEGPRWFERLYHREKGLMKVLLSP